MSYPGKWVKSAGRKDGKIMLYRCGHKGCDVCGARECADALLKRYGDYLACESCVIKCLRLGVDVAASFSTFIDVERPCGRKKDVAIIR